MKYKYIVLIVTIFIASLLLTKPLIYYFQIPVFNEPNLGGYTSDAISFLKTFYLMEKGDDYYSAFKIARSNFINGESLLQSDTFTWRLPTIFYLWTFLAATGEQILTLFLFLTMLFVLSIYLMIKKISKSNLIATLSALLIIPYIFDTLRHQTAFLFTEWWGLIIFTYGLTAFIYGKTKLSFVMFTLSIFIRELFIIPLAFLALTSIVENRKYRYWLLMGGIFFVFYILHSYLVSNSVMSASSHFSLVNRFHGINIANIHPLLAFSMRDYILYGLKTHYLLLILGFTSLLLNAFYLKIKEARYLLICALSFMITLPFISVRENDYWGVVFVPFLISSVPLLFNLKKAIK